jgi:hypothetical protein
MVCSSMATAAPADAQPRPRLVYLPNTCPENRKHHTHLKLLSHVDPEAPYNLGFEGRIMFCGARIPEPELGERPVCLEYCGPQGQAKAGKHRTHLYILWRYDFDKMSWVEIARALSPGWSWAPILRKPAALELAPPHLTAGAATERGREAAEELLTAIDARLVGECAEAQIVALTSLYDQVAGRIARAQSR